MKEAKKVQAKTKSKQRLTAGAMAVLLWIALTAVMAVWVVNSGINLKNLSKMKQYRHDLLQQRSLLLEDNKALEEKLRSLQDHDYMRERIARLKLGLMRPGEKMVKVKKVIDNKNITDYTPNR